MSQEMIDAIKYLKNKFAEEGFIILGIFGSFARGDNTTASDIDILYETEKKFGLHNKGWEYFARIEEIKKEIQKITGREADIVNIKALKEIGRKCILPEVIYVR